MISSNTRLVGAAAGLALLPALALGRSGELALFELDEQLQRETAVASSKAYSIRETPGVVTLLTREEILGAGARDLLDVLLLMVPGFQPAVDVTGVVSVGFRGIWGHEGKILLLVDGIEMNELLFGTVQLGNHYPVEQIQAVEIVRGPGSALYGGSAELAVVKVTTRGARDLGGAALAGSYGQGPGGLVRRSLTAGYGAVSGDAAFSAQATVGQGNRSDGRYVDLEGGSYAMAGQAALDPLQLNVAASWRGLDLRLFHDDYATTTRDGYGLVGAEAAPQRFRTTAADAAWRVPLAEGVTITPRVTYRRHVPWQTPDARFEALFYDKTADRLSARVTFAAARETVSFVAGGEAYRDRAWLDQPATPQLDFGGRGHVSFTNVAGFGELGWDAPVANLLVGGRIESHSTAGTSFVPRIALTKLWHPLHLKLLYASAFRAPAIENVSFNDTRPERTRVIEAEVGCALGDRAYVGVNAFDVHLDGPIVYIADAQTGVETYQNFARTGSRGIEAELRLAGRRHSATLQYAFYTAAGRNRVDAYEVPGHDELALGFAAHRATLLARFALGERLSIAPSLAVTSARYAYRDAGGPVALPATALLNVFASWRNAFTRGLELGVGLYDLLGASVTYPQPYASGHAPLPGPGREVLARVSWEPRD